MRHNSNCAGNKYGKNTKDGDIIGVKLDMIKVSYYIRKLIFIREKWVI